MDFALQLGDSPVAFIEAKGLGRSISDEDVNQLRSYMRQELNVDWGMITNGNAFEILLKGGADNTRGEVSLVNFELVDLAENPGLIDILSKESITSGKSQEIAQKMEQAGKAIEEVSTKKDELARAIGDTLRNELDVEIPVDIESQAVGFIDDILFEIDEQRIRFGRATPTPSPLPDPGDGDYVVSVSDDDAIIAADDQAEAMAETVNLLISNYDLISNIEPLPYVPGRKKAIINSEPYYPDGEREMMLYSELSGGYYLDTHMNKEGKKRELRRLAEICNVDLVFSGSW